MTDAPDSRGQVPVGAASSLWYRCIHCRAWRRMSPPDESGRDTDSGHHAP